MKRLPRRREATPDAQMILSKRMADHKPHDMICELVDNALDADAQRVWIELGRRSVTVADDGSGMEDINDAIRFGKGTRGGRQRGGRRGRRSGLREAEMSVDHWNPSVRRYREEQGWTTDGGCDMPRRGGLAALGRGG